VDYCDAKSFKEFCLKNEFECEVFNGMCNGLRFGICQGLSIESTTESDKYLLVCKDGPVFNIKTCDMSKVDLSVK